MLSAYDNDPHEKAAAYLNNDFFTRLLIWFAYPFDGDPHKWDGMCSASGIRGFTKTSYLQLAFSTLHNMP